MTLRETLSTPPLEAYLASRFWRDSPAQAASRRLAADEGLDIAITPAQGRMLELLTKLTGAQRVLEIGTCFGYSTLWLARGLRPGGVVETIEANPARAERARQLFSEHGLSAKIRVRNAPALDELPVMRPPFDLAFIDAVKGEYPQYLRHCLRLVRSGGLIVADNVLWRGEVAGQGPDHQRLDGLRRFNDEIADEGRFCSTILPMGDGLSISVVQAS